MKYLSVEQRQICWLAKVMALAMALGTVYLLFRPQ